MKQQIYGLTFDYEGGASTSLAVHLDAEDKRQLIAYQIRMLREHRIPRMLSFTTEEINGELVLRYDITAKRRFVQLLHVQPPDMQLALESAYQLVRSLRECASYMLSENQIALHEDVVFGSGSLRDFQLCYLPIEGLNKKPVTDELRCLLLRLFSAVDGGFEGKEAASILGVLSEENYSLKQLEEQLQRVWLSGDSDRGEPLTESQPTEKRSMGWQLRMKQWLQQRFSRPSEAADAGLRVSDPADSLSLAIEQHVQPSGRTEVLSAREPADNSEITLCLSRDGEESKYVMSEDRWIIGRSETGIHHTDLSEGVSRIHCEISKQGDELEVKDLGSLNGSFLNGERMIPYKAYPFTSSDVLRYARTELRVAPMHRSLL